MNYHKFSKLYSYSRVSKYEKAAKGNKKITQEMYYANARMSQAFQPLISFLEVILRNQLHYALASHFNDVEWLIHQKTGFMSSKVLTHRDKKTGKIIINDFLKKEIERAEITLLNKGRNVTAGRVIAELNFGFWNSLYESHHYALLKGVPCTIFKNLPAGYGRKSVNELIKKVRVLRNRISHNEPICFDGRSYNLDYVRDMHNMIQNVLSWIDSDIVPSLVNEDLNKVTDEIEKTSQIINRIENP